MCLRCELMQFVTSVSVPRLEPEAQSRRCKCPAAEHTLRLLHLFSNVTLIAWKLLGYAGVLGR